MTLLGQLTADFDLFFISCLQHFVFFISRLIDMLVPDIPQSLEITIKREAYRAKQALSEHHTLLEKEDGSAEVTEDEMPDV